MEWIDDFQKNYFPILDTLCLSLILGILGIAITIFTVVYSFMENTRDKIRKYQEEITHSQREVDPITKSSLRFAEEYWRKMRRTNNLLLWIIIPDILLFIIFVVSQFIGNPIFSIISYVLTAILLLYSVIVVLIYIYDYYHKYRNFG